MNWKLIKDWAALSPTNKIVTGCVVIISVLSSVTATMFYMTIGGKNEQIESLEHRIVIKDDIIKGKDAEIALCKNESIQRERDNLEYERQRQRYADSMKYALTTAEKALKKVANRANK